MAQIESDEELNEEIGEFNVDIADQQAEMEEQISQASSRGRGRPKVKESWTRVISLNDNEAQQIASYELAADLMMVQNLPAVPAQRLDGPWQPVFFSKDYLKSLPKESLQDC